MSNVKYKTIYLLEERTEADPSWSLADDAEPITNRRRAEHLARESVREVQNSDFGPPIPGYAVRVAVYQRTGP